MQFTNIQKEPIRLGRAMVHRTNGVLFSLLVLLLFLAPVAVAASPSTDQYIRGYAEAILNLQFGVTSYDITVQDGTIVLTPSDMKHHQFQEVVDALSRINGVVSVNITSSESAESVSAFQAKADAIQINKESQPLFQKARLFRPLIADPRWPHFFIGYQYYFGDREIRNVGATSFGETLPFYRGDAPWGGAWQIGLDAAVFAIFDLDADSHDLVNADYWVGIPVSYRKDMWAFLFRVYHQSSHLGDEFLLRSRVDRVNLSYEAADFKASCDVRDWLRLYGGSNYIFHKEPSDLKPWAVQYGIEWRYPGTFAGGTLKPLAGADFKNREESDWDTDVSLRAGFQIESIKMNWNTLYLMLEYFNGHTPNGQFYDRTVEYLSVSTHFYFN